MNIAGARNYVGHGSSAQKSIWHFEKMLSDFHEVNAKIAGFNEADLLEGENDFYLFMKKLYLGMYEDPVKFLIPTAQYDEYIKSIDPAKVFEKAHQNDTKESKLRNTFQKAIHFYPDFFYHIGLAAEEFCPQTFRLIINESKFDEIINLLGRPYVHMDNVNRLNTLISIGLEVEKNDGICYLSNPFYPKMFLGLMVLLKAPDSKYKYMNYLRLDYKGFERIVPEMDDIKLTLKSEHARIIDSFSQLFSESNLKLRVKPLRSLASSHGWKAEYVLNGKNVFGFFGEPDYLAFYIYFNDAKNVSEMAKRLKETNTQLYDWFVDKFPERLCKCKYNRAVIFGNIKRRICGLSNKAEIINPDEEDIANGIEVIKLFRNI